ncbi:hypothetical protein [Mycobacteroides abscessus]|uniref:hypothetical protein n=1 Tax=Mycobacteroides abscessus TaxID=36809 RepID=UPI000C25C6C1|nr:hypothetical protein [Mycobacteroides abscessus]
MSRYNTEELAIIESGYSTGGFPIGKQQLIEIFRENRDATGFDQLRERMRKALMSIESENMTMEQISSAAHICAVVAHKLEEQPDL